jgi:hypothetical protein
VVARDTTLVSFDLKRKTFGPPVRDRHVLVHPRVDLKSRRALSAPGDGSIRFFDLTASKALGTSEPREAAGVTEYGHAIQAVQWADSGDHVWWVNKAGAVGTAQSASGTWKVSFHVRGYARPSRLVPLADGQVVVFGDRTLVLSPLSETRVPWRYEQPGGYGLPFDAEGTEIWFSSPDGLRVLNSSSLELSPPSPAGKVRELRLSPGGPTAALAFADRKEIEIWDRKERKLLRACPLPALPGPLVMSPGGTRLAVTAGSPSQIHLIDVATGQLEKNVPGTKQPLLNPLHLGPDGGLFGWTLPRTTDGLPVALDQAVQDWDLAGGVLKREIPVRGYHSIAPHPKAPFILFGGYGWLLAADPKRAPKNELVVRETDSLKVVWESPSPKGAVRTVWSLDGTELLTLTEQGTLVRTPFAPK